MANSNPTTPVTPLSEEEKAYLKEREDIVVEGLQTNLKTSLEAAKALYEIDHYVCANGRKLWQHSSPTFPAYCKAKWGYERTQAFRQRTTGEFLSSPGLVVEPANARQVQELLTEEKVPVELRVECWNWMVAEAQKAHTGPDQEFAILVLKGKECDALVWRYLETKSLADTARLAAKKAVQERRKGMKAIEVLRTIINPGDDQLPALLDAIELELNNPERLQMTEGHRAQANSSLEQLKNLLHPLDAGICSQIQKHIGDLYDRVEGSATYRGDHNFGPALTAFRALKQACEPAVRRAELAKRVDAFFGPRPGKVEPISRSASRSGRKSPNPAKTSSVEPDWH